jgi:hypothetical protein
MPLLVIAAIVFICGFAAPGILFMVGFGDKLLPVAEETSEGFRKEKNS